MRNILLVILVICLAGAAIAGDWKMYLYDPAHSSFNAAQTKLDQDSIRKIQDVWLFTSGALLATAVTVSDGVLYFGDWGGNFHAIRASDGAELWSQFVGISAPPATLGCQPAIGVTSQAVVVDDRVYVGGGDAALYALDKTSGSQIYRVELADTNTGAYLWSSIIYSGNALYLGVASLGDCPLVRGEMVRVDLNDPKNPKVRFLAPPDEVGGGIWSTPAVDEEAKTVYVTTGTGEQDAERGLFGGTLLSLNATTLEPKAHYFLPSNSVEEDIEWGSSPTLFQTSDGTKLVGATGKDGVLYACSRDELSLVWTRKLSVSCICPECGCGSLSTPAFDGTTLYVGAGVRDPDGTPVGSVYALNPDTGEVLWVQDLNGTVIAPVTVANGLVYVSSTMGLLVFNAQTGEPVWDDGNYGLLYSQTVVQDGSIYNTYLNGDVVARRLMDTSSGSNRPAGRGTAQRR